MIALPGAVPVSDLKIRFTPSGNTFSPICVGTMRSAICSIDSSDWFIQLLRAPREPAFAGSAFRMQASRAQRQPFHKPVPVPCPYSFF